MSITERQRHQLLAWYEKQMGPELAAVAMELTPPTSWGDLATKRDLDHLGNQLRGEFHSEINQLRGEIGELRGELHHETGELRGQMGELRGEIGEVRGEVGHLRAEMHDLSSRTLRIFIGLLIATQSATVAILTLLQ